MKGRRRKLFRTTAVAVLPTLILCLIGLELGLRAVGRPPSNITDGFFIQHGNSYRLKKNLTKKVHNPSYEYVVHTNSLGFRDSQTGDRALDSNPYIVFLGESLTFGNGVEYEETFVGRIAAEARAKNIETMNLAVGGHRLEEQEALLRDFVNSAPRMPSMVIVNFSVPMIEGFSLPHSDIVIKNGYIFQKDKWLLPYIRIMLGNTSASYCFFRDSFRKLQSQVPFLGADPSDQMAWILDPFSKQSPLTDSETVEKFHIVMKRIQDEILSFEAIPVFVYLPISYEYMLESLLAQAGKDPDLYDFGLYKRILQDYCDEHGVRFIDLFPSLQESFDKGEKLDFSNDPHYNVRSHRYISDQLFELLFPESETR